MIITSPVFENDGMIPKKYTCDGEGINPEFQIQNIPGEAKSLALIMYDPDAPMAGGFTHWVVWNIDPKTMIIKEESIPSGSSQGENSAGTIAYIAPCPHQGMHHYFFYLYALNDVINLPSGALVVNVKEEIEKYLITKAELMGRYQRE